jgi:methyl-accepting chemotaxis protein
MEANSIAKLVGELEDYGEVLNASSQIANQGYSKMRETVDAIRKISGSVQDSINDMVSDRADLSGVNGNSNSQSAVEQGNPPEGNEFVNPFDKLKS